MKKSTSTTPTQNRRLRARTKKCHPTRLPRLFVVAKRRLRVNARMPRLSGSRPGRRVAGAMPNPFGQMSLRTTGGSGNPYGGHGGTGFNPANSGCVKDGPRRATDTVPFCAAFVPFSRDPTEGRRLGRAMTSTPSRGGSIGSVLTRPRPAASVPPKRAQHPERCPASARWSTTAGRPTRSGRAGAGAPMSDHERRGAGGRPLAPTSRRARIRRGRQHVHGVRAEPSPPNARENPPSARARRARPPRNAARNAAREDRREERDASRKKPFFL